jgi:hypothetical protein
MAKSLVNKTGLKVHNQAPRDRIGSPVDQLESVDASESARPARKPTHRFSRKLPTLKSSHSKAGSPQIPVINQSMVNIPGDLPDPISESHDKND